MIPYTLNIVDFENILPKQDFFNIDFTIIVIQQKTSNFGGTNPFRISLKKLHELEDDKKPYINLTK